MTIQKILTRCLLIVTASISMAYAQNLEQSILVEYESPILIKRGDVSVTLADFQAYLDWQVPAEDQLALIANPARIEGILENIVLTKSFLDLTAQDGLLIDPVVQARMNLAIARELRMVFRDWYYQSIELDSYEASARELYLVNRERFLQPKLYDIEHLLIPIDSARSAVDAMVMIAEAHRKLLAGASFGEVIEVYANADDSDSNGLLENIKLTELVPSVADAVSATDVGEFSAPVQSSFGWHIVKVVASHKQEKQSWEDARPMAEAIARENHLITSFERKLREINAMPIQFSDGAVKRILDSYGLDGFGIDALQSSTMDNPN